MGTLNSLIGQKAPEFTLDGVLHKKFDTYTIPQKGKWSVLLFYPLDFTFVCPTEIVAFSEAVEKFSAVNTNLYGISVDSKFTHLAWTETERKDGGVGQIDFPLLADLNKEVAKSYGILLDAGVSLRGLFIIDDEGTIQQATVNNLAVGRGVDETLRLVQAFQHTKSCGEVCPANWTPGAETMKPDPEGLKAYASKNA